jgi:hypothetical protein
MATLNKMDTFIIESLAVVIFGTCFAVVQAEVVHLKTSNKHMILTQAMLEPTKMVEKLF